MKVLIEPVSEAAAADWLRLRGEFWTTRDADGHRAAIAEFFAGQATEPAAVFLARSEQGDAVGLLELSIRAYAEGCERPNPAYVEGIYVVPEYRRVGVAGALMAAAEAWARSRGCCDLASDSAPENAASEGLHAAAGFRDIGLVRCWAKRLQ